MPRTLNHALNGRRQAAIFQTIIHRSKLVGWEINVPFQYKNRRYRRQGLGWFSYVRLRMANHTVTAHYARAYNTVKANQPPEELFISATWYILCHCCSTVTVAYIVPTTPCIISFSVLIWLWNLLEKKQIAPGGPPTHGTRPTPTAS